MRACNPSMGVAYRPEPKEVWQFSQSIISWRPPRNMSMIVQQLHIEHNDRPQLLRTAGILKPNYSLNTARYTRPHPLDQGVAQPPTKRAVRSDRSRGSMYMLQVTSTEILRTHNSTLPMLSRDPACGPRRERGGGRRGGGNNYNTLGGAG